MAEPPVPPAATRWVTRANALTTVRLAAAPLLAFAVVEEAALAAFTLFWLAVATDLLDGRIARHYGEASALGGLLDHATDAIFVTVGLGAFASRGEIPVVLPWMIAGAFIQYTLDSSALRGRPLRTSQLGRWNGIGYFVLLGVPVVRDGLGLGWPPGALVSFLGWLLVAATALSMADRLAALRR